MTLVSGALSVVETKIWSQNPREFEPELNWNIYTDHIYFFVFIFYEFYFNFCNKAYIHFWYNQKNPLSSTTRDSSLLMHLMLDLLEKAVQCAPNTLLSCQPFFFPSVNPAAQMIKN